MADDQNRKPGTRKDGKPYKEGNTREDGSYDVGRGRTSKHTRFAVGDGRPRGKRAKGTKNFLTEWREELAEKVTLNEGGKTKKVSKRRALIKSQINRAMKSSDRAAEAAMRYAELSEKREPGLQADDLAIIENWMASVSRTGDSDDIDQADHGGDGGHENA